MNSIDRLILFVRKMREGVEREVDEIQDENEKIRESMRQSVVVVVAEPKQTVVETPKQPPPPPPEVEDDERLQAAEIEVAVENARRILRSLRLTVPELGKGSERNVDSSRENDDSEGNNNNNNNDQTTFRPVSFSSTKSSNRVPPPSSSSSRSSVTQKSNSRISSSSRPPSSRPPSSRPPSSRLPSAKGRSSVVLPPASRTRPSQPAPAPTRNVRHNAARPDGRHTAPSTSTNRRRVDCSSARRDGAGVAATTSGPKPVPNVLQSLPSARRTKAVPDALQDIAVSKPDRLKSSVGEEIGATRSTKAPLRLSPLTKYFLDPSFVNEANADAFESLRKKLRLGRKLTTRLEAVGKGGAAEEVAEAKANFLRKLKRAAEDEGRTVEDLSSPDKDDRVSLNHYRRSCHDCVRLFAVTNRLSASLRLATNDWRRRTEATIAADRRKARLAVESILRRYDPLPDRGIQLLSVCSKFQSIAEEKTEDPFEGGDSTPPLDLLCRPTLRYAEPEAMKRFVATRVENAALTIQNEILLRSLKILNAMISNVDPNDETFVHVIKMTSSILNYCGEKEPIVISR